MPIRETQKENRMNLIKSIVLLVRALLQRQPQRKMSCCLDFSAVAFNMRGPIVVALVGATVLPVCAADQAIILNENSYWRAAYLFGNERVSPERLKEGPSKWVDAKVLEKSMKDLQKYAGHAKFKHRLKNFSMDKWYEHVYMSTTSKQQYSHNHGLTWEKLPLPEGWAQPDFNDLDWPRQRNPHLMGTPPEDPFFSGMSQLDIENKFSYLDRLQPGILAQVKPDTIQPYWLGVKIPKDAKAGEYTGTVTVSGQGMSQAVLPLTVEVMDWKLPDPSAFQTVIGIEQNPYAVAKQYNAKLWSDEHVRLLEASMKQLARVGNDWLNIPCVRKTQYGNREDQMIQWTRKRGGTLAFDFAVLDRYLDLALKHWGTPRVVNFVVVPGNQWDISVNVFDETSGKNIIVQLCDTKTGLLEERKADWAVFAKAVQGHMKTRNLLAATYWGYRWDYGGYENLVTFLAEATPEIYWTRAPHHFGILEKRDKISTCQYGWGSDVDLLQYGWKSEQFHLFNGSCRDNPINENNPPHVYRTFVDTGLNLGLRGIAQVGGDHWESFGDGFTMGVPRYAGFSPESLLYPGDQGAVSSVRYEALLQGLQEAEARICIEQAIEGGKISDALKAELKHALVSYANEKAFSFGYNVYLKENYGWMARARIIYNAAARAK